MYNKRYFSHRLAFEMNRLLRDSKELTLLFLDIDSFLSFLHRSDKV
ncbi:hypothetical protein [Tepidibacillus marianensis]